MVLKMLEIQSAMIIFLFNTTISFYIFISALVSLLISLALLMFELQISINAINIQLDEMKEK